MTERLIQGTILAVVLTLLLNSLIYAFGMAQDVGFMVTQPQASDPQMVTIMRILMVSGIVTLIGGVVLWGLAQFTDNALMIFLWVASIVGLVSLWLPYSRAIGRGTFATLGLMHVLTASIAALCLAIFFQRCETCR